MGKRSNYRNIELGGGDELEDVDPNIDDLQFTISEEALNPNNNKPTNKSIATTTATTPPEEDGSYQIRQDESLLAILKKNSAHPFVCIAHLTFKIASLALYIVGGFIVSGSGANFVVFNAFIIVFLAMDFYLTQKISGRLLVGLRWHNVLEPDGIHTRWIFESREGQMQVNTFDRIIFWSTLYMNPALWFLFLFIDLMKLNVSWLIPCAIACSLSMANLYGFYRCSKEQQQRLHTMMIQGAQFGVNRVTSFTAGSTGFMTNVLSSFVNRATSTTTTTNNNR